MPHQAGVATIDVRGGHGSGLRTLWMLVARTARLEGYVPVAARALASRPWLDDALLTRHVALLAWRDADRGASGALAALVARLGAASTRRHVLIRFGRNEDADGRALHVDRMGGTAMQAMVYLDREDGPSLDELQHGIREAEGRPGTLVERLRAVPPGQRRAAIALVHESSPDYAIDHAPPARAPAPPRRRISEGLRGAPARAARLAAQRTARRRRQASDARHAGVLRSRGAADEARCGLALGWILRNRGRSIEAMRQFDRARRLQPESPIAVHAAIASGIVWTDDDRLAEAEALLRSAQSAAVLVSAIDAEHAATLALARCVLWRGGVDEAAALLSRSGDGGPAG